MEDLARARWVAARLRDLARRADSVTRRLTTLEVSDWKSPAAQAYRQRLATHVATVEHCGRLLRLAARQADDTAERVRDGP